METRLILALALLTLVEGDAFNSTIIKANISELLTYNVSSETEFIFHFEGVVDNGLRVYAVSEKAIDEQPVVVVVRQKRGVLSWQIPVYVKRDDIPMYDRYYSVNRTLCPSDNNPKLLRAATSDVYITVSTSSKKWVEFSLMLYRQEKFFMSLNETTTALVSPSGPIFFQVELPEEVDAVLLKYNSSDSYCSTLSIQNISCPVYDLDRNVKFEGLYQSADTTAGLTIRRDLYPKGFYIVVVVKTDDFSCHRPVASEVHTFQNCYGRCREKTIELSLETKITQEEYLIATFGALGMFVGAYILVFLISCVLCIKDYRVGTLIVEDRRPILEAQDSVVSGEGDRPLSDLEVAGTEVDENPEEFMEDEVVVDENSSYGAVPRTVVRRQRHRASSDQLNDTTDTDPGDQEDENKIVTVDEQVISVISDHGDNPGIIVGSSSTLNEDDIDFLDDAELEKEVFRTKTFMYVSDLARKTPQALAKKSSLYQWNLMTIAIFYGLPVVQLVLTYQNVTNSTGNQDMCYYNFLCAHPLGAVSDFNHVFSNLGYVMLGILFVIIVWRKSFKHYRNIVTNPELDSHYGIPQHFGMYYAMGIALIMEGIMSGCYHVCPNHTNFQFDTAFMYTISILILLKIYQTRHPDINANAYTAFGALAFIIFVGVIGVLHGNTYFWIFFCTLHVMACLILSFQIYYMGRWRVNGGIFKRIWLLCYNDVRAAVGGHWRGLKPMYMDRMILLVVLNAVNWGLSAYGVSSLANRGADFASFLLAIFISNVMLYTMFYIVMKLRYRERIGAQPATYIVLSTFTWFGSLYFFLNKSTSWVRTPAESRHLNQECKLFHFYDNHDIWHFLSATSLFLSFMILLTLDDDLENVPRDKIPVF